MDTGGQTLTKLTRLHDKSHPTHHRPARGYVIDYIEPLFVNFAVFNFADILVTVGAAILISLIIISIYMKTINRNPAF